MRRFSRRQALKVVAAAVGVPLGLVAIGGLQPAYALETWHGESLGGPASLSLWHPNADFARRTILRMRAEVERLEVVFSLFRADTEISRLNAEGRLARPSLDMVAVLAAARRIAELSGGAFDPTVQPLWQLYERHFRSGATLEPASAEINAARRLVGFAGIDIGAGAVELRPGTAVTLNGIAQGYITDRIADLLRQEGFEHAMVELGETRAIGAATDGKPFAVGLRNPRAPDVVDRTIGIADQSLSISGGYGLRFGASTSHHIFDPATGRSATRLLDVAVIAPRAMTADALSTAIYVAGEEAAPGLLAAYPGSRALVTRVDGSAADMG